MGTRIACLIGVEILDFAGRLNFVSLQSSRLRFRRWGECTGLEGESVWQPRERSISNVDCRWSWWDRKPAMELWREIVVSQRGFVRTSRAEYCAAAAVVVEGSVE